MTPKAEHEYIGPDVVSERIPALSKQHLAQLRYTGNGPKFLKPSPRIVLYRWADVIAWLEASERTITSREAV